MKNSVGKIPALNGDYLSNPNARTQTISYFILSVLGFSFWFFMVVPFASHRESYWWLGMAQSHPFATAFSFISKTYRPLAQGLTWLGFLILNPGIFPTSIVRQALLQGFVYGMFVLAWWLIYSAAPQRRLFALVACVAGGVFFSGYVHLFHIYGIFYIPVMLTLGALLHFHASETFDKYQVQFALISILLAFWHPFASALFAGFYFGFYLDTFRQRSKSQHVQAILVLLVGIIVMACLVVLFPTMKDTMSLGTRLFGFFVSYQTNEVNWFASLVAFLLTQMTVFSMEVSPKLKIAAFFLVSVLSAVFLLKSLPLLLLWICAVLIKLLWLRAWSLFFLMLTAALLPFGGGIGTPIYALFAIIVAVYVTSDWSWAEKVVFLVKTRYVIGTIAAATMILLMVRAGIDVPIVARAARPLLAERERTYQLENILAWLHNSAYCGCEVTFAEDAGNPVDSVKSAITRQYRPPSSLEDVQLFWKTVLQCRKADQSESKTRTAMVTFGMPALAELTPVFVVKGKYAGDATVWIQDSQK